MEAKPKTRSSALTTKKDLEQEELLLRKFRARCRFRAIARLAAANAYWLADFDYPGYNFHLRVQHAVKGFKPSTLKTLTLSDKALLNKPAADRTKIEKDYLNRILGNLKCFKRYPNYVKRKLAAVTYFKYYSPNRVIVREGHLAQALYFIASGEVTVTKTSWDGVLNQNYEEEISSLGAGDMFGEVSLIHNIPRVATCSTKGHCEFLVMLRPDFKEILYATLQAHWNVIEQAMLAFTYFKDLDEVNLREGCIIAKLNTYDTDETIYGDGVGFANFVYFVISGRCQMIETLDVCVSQYQGREYYSLYDPYESKVVSEHHLDEQIDDSEFIHLKPKTEESESSKESVEIPVSKRSKVSIKIDGQHIYKPEDVIDEKEDEVDTLHSYSEIILKRKSSILGSNHSLRSTEHSSIEGKPKNLRKYFMQVCQMTTGGSFGLGENMRDRRIVALTPVCCLILPVVWLLQNNRANIWTRIKHHLEKKIPNKEKVFKEFVKEMLWMRHREQTVEEVVARTIHENHTTIHDVPYHIRMEEGINL